MSSLEKIKKDFVEVVRVITETFGEHYAAKNPGLVQHMLNLVQQQENRDQELAAKIPPG